MKTVELVEYFYRNAPYVDPAHTVDHLIYGDPQAEVKRILVTWMADIHAVCRAAEIGADTIITHEPTLGSHENEYQTYLSWDDDVVRKAAAKTKVRLLEQNGIALIRNHDAWDRFPGIGIPFSWAKFLGIEGQPAASTFHGYLFRYEIQPVRLSELAARICKRTALLDEPSIPYFGDGSKMVSAVGIGTGAICPIDEFINMGCDVSVVTDDGCCFWDGISRAIDLGHAIIRVAHATSEEPGIQNLCSYINENIPGVTAEYFRTPLRYHFVTHTE